MGGHHPPRATTIGWRLAHPAVGVETYIDRSDDGVASTMADSDSPGSAEEAVVRLHAAQDRLLTHYSAVDDAALTRSRPPTHWGEPLPLWQLMWTLVVEQFHHGAEIGTRRDLKRGHANSEWWPELQGAQWWPLQ